MLLDRFKNYIKVNDLFEKSDKILLTVSGGVDSMVMLSLFARTDYEVGVAHCNFQLRGVESEEDEVLVEKAAARYGVQFYNKRFDTAGEMDRTGESVQIAARRLRYDWFAELSEKYGYTAIAIAHHADDSIETFFINLFRGTGLRGLTGIHKIRGKIVRPLLFASRKEILDYAQVNRIDFREDSSNRSTKYLRNKIRLGLVPRMREINTHFTDVMTANVQRLTDAQMFINRGIERIREEVEERSGDTVIIDPAKIDPAFPHNFVIYELLTTYGFKGDVVESLVDALHGGQTGKRFYAREYAAYTDRGRIFVGPIEDHDDCAVDITRSSHRIYVGNSVLFFDYMDVDLLDSFDVPENVALVDADKLRFPLLARLWSEGDSFIPFGMTGHKKVSDFLIDAKVPLMDKKRQFVISSGDEIVWLVGRRTDDRYRITKETETILRITKEVL